MDLNQIKDSATLIQYFQNFRKAPDEAKANLLKEIRESKNDGSFNANDKQGCVNYLTNFVSDKDEKLTTWIAVAYLLTYADTTNASTFQTLANVALNSTQVTDRRAWALYMVSNLELSESDLRSKQNEINLIRDLIDSSESKIRKWAIYGLSGLLKTTPDLSKDLIKKLLERWKKEFDIAVLEQIVRSLGLIAGGILTTDPDEFEPIKALLIEANQHPHPDVSQRVPWAVHNIAGSINATAQPTTSTTYCELADVLKNRLEYRLSKDDQWKLKEAVEDLSILGEYYAAYVTNSQNKLHYDAYETFANKLLDNYKMVFSKQLNIQSPSEPLDYEVLRGAITGIRDLILLDLHISMDRVAHKGIAYILDEISLEPNLSSEVKSRSVRTVNDLYNELDKYKEKQPQTWAWGEYFLAKTVTPKLEQLVASENEDVTKAATDMLLLVNKKDAHSFLVDLILEDKLAETAAEFIIKFQTKKAIEKTDRDTLVNRARNCAARALGGSSGPEFEEAIKMLANALEVPGRQSDLAEKALQTIGGTYASEELIASARREWLDSKYFTPLEEADQEGKKLLRNAVTGANWSYAIYMVIVGIVVLMGLFSAFTVFQELYQEQTRQNAAQATPSTSLQNQGQASEQANLGATSENSVQETDSTTQDTTDIVQNPVQETQTQVTTNPPTGDTFVVGGLIYSAITLLIALLAPFFWRSANAGQRASADLARVIAGFHSYIARMRLIGLGFAYAYTSEKFENSGFLQNISAEAGNAIKDAGQVFLGIGQNPLSTTTVTVPSVIGMKPEEAESAIRAAGLLHSTGGSEKSDKVDKDKIAKQEPVAGMQVNPGTSVKLTLSQGK